jgi:hypothetical protein
MVAPPEISRKTQPGKVKAAPSTMGRKQRGQGEHYRGCSFLLLPAFARALTVLGVRQHPLTERLPLLVP